MTLLLKQKQIPPHLRKFFRPAGLKQKDDALVPQRFALAAQADGWYIRSEIIWAKKAPMPESVTDRCTRSHEQVWMLSKSRRYFFDSEAIREPNGEDSHPGTYRQDGKYAPLGRAAARSGVSVNTTGGRNRRDVWWTDKTDTWLLGPEPFMGVKGNVRRVRVATDAVSDDTMCKVSPDCPVHGGLFAWNSTALHGVRASDLFARNLGNDSRPVQAQPVDSDAIDQQRAEAIVGENSDSHRPPYVPSATDHNNGNHRTGLDLGTNQPCTSFDETRVHIDGRPALPLFGETPLEHTDGNNTSVDADEDEIRFSPSARIPSRNSGSGIASNAPLACSIPVECTCEFYHETTETANHFATFPQALVEPCISAGTSARGVCSHCGKPWVRVVERSGGTIGRGWTDHKGDSTEGMNQAAFRVGSQTDANGKPYTVTTLGWQPSCRCSCEPVPATVMDPFHGSGTTGVVALRLGRAYVGVDIAETYLNEITSERMKNGVQIGLAL